MPDPHRSASETAEDSALLALHAQLRAVSASHPLRVLTSRDDSSPLDITFHDCNRESGDESQATVRIFKGRQPDSGEYALTTFDGPTRLTD